MESGVNRLGAKFGREKDRAADRYHPLICHLLDVAAVATEIWDQALSPHARRLLASGLGLSPDSARAWAAFIAGAHDLGKACASWQSVDVHHQQRLSGTPLRATAAAEHPNHGLVTTVVLQDYLERLGMASAVASRIATASGGHHGYFVLANSAGQRSEAYRGEGKEQSALWANARRELLDSLRTTVAAVGSLPTGTMPNPAAMLLAGLVSVADWIGSADQFFPWAMPGTEADVSDTAAYFARARKQAKAALEGLHWTRLATEDQPLTPEVLGLPTGATYRPLQREALEIASNAREPRFVIIEAPMGEGKTEAAIILADHWRAAGFRGTYFALPTQATANQLHARVKTYLERRLPNADVNLLLVHGGIASADQDLLPSAVDDTEGDGNVAAGAWFLPKKRSLLGEFGVGTIDQSLFSVLQVRHVFVRLFGLAGKPVVIDEVHAYDTYMTELLERLLQWLGALQAPVVMLSATLPTERRAKLLEAYARGSGGAVPAASDAQSVPYPRATWLDGSGAHATTFETSGTSRRTLRIQRLNDSIDSVATTLSGKLANGGCAAVICNTVGRAQAMFTELKARLDCEVGLLHARFRAMDREAREKRYLGMFGPPWAGGERPPRFVLVATQVVEQSLDLDFDLMITDLAPMDLLLQRSGRMHRHDRERPKGLEEPVLHIRWPGQVPPEFDRGSAHVYDPHILLRTWHALQGRDAIAIPGDVQELIDQVYASDECPPGDPLIDEMWHETWAKMQARKGDEEREARERRLGTPTRLVPLDSLLRNPREEDAEDLHPALQALTRLAEPTIDLVLLDANSPLQGRVERELSRQKVRELLERSVKVAGWPGVPALATQEIPKGFASRAALRRHRMLVLDEAGAGRAGNVRFTYHRDLGLLLTRLEEEVPLSSPLPESQRA